jgi:hypothetical protein
LTLLIFATAAQASTPGPITSCQTLDTGGTYVLQNNVSSNDTCFPIQADNITLNLNGHTITYGMGPSVVGKARYGLSAVACWDPTLSGIAQGAACGNGGNQLTVAGPGMITQSPNAGPYSHGIRIGQTNQGGSPTFHDITFNFSARSTAGIWCDGGCGGEVAYNNTFNNNVVTINSRCESEGISEGSFEGAGVTGGQTIHNETINGGPQDGIMESVPGSSIYNNIIRSGNPTGVNQGTGATCVPVCTSPNGCQYSNDFGIQVWASNVSVHNNTVQPKEGRGIQVANPFSAGSALDNIQVYDNIVTAVEFPNNVEYNGCELGGAYGIQLNTFSSPLTHSSIYNNTVTATATACEAYGFGLSSNDSTTNSTHDNHFECDRAAGSTALCSGLRAAGKQYAGWQPLISTRDAYLGDTSATYVYWSGNQQWTCAQCTFGKGKNPDPTSWVTFSWMPSNSSSDPWFIIDPTFTGGATKDSNDLPAFAAYAGQSASYTIQWTYITTVQQSGTAAPLSGAQIAITDATGTQECSGTTNASGIFSCVVNDAKYAASGSQYGVTNFNPLSVSISHSGCTTLNHNVAVSGTTNQTVQLVCGTPPPPPSTSPCDVNGDGVVNVADVQIEANMALGIRLCTNPSGTCTVASVQRVVNAALGGQCVAP